MKRVLLHALFWLLYFFQNVLLIFFVNGTRLAQTPGADSLLAMANCAVLLLPKMLFTYWVFRFGLGSTDRSIGQGRRIVHTVLALLLALLLYRALVVYVIDPYIYHWRSGQPLWYALGFLVALMDIGFVGGAALAIRLFRQQRAAGLRESALLQAQLESELRFLRNQTNPHFLFNTLNNIYALARKNSDAVPEVILRLSKLLRFMLYESAKPRISIAEEVRVLDDYIELEKIRYDSRLTVNFYREIDNDAQPVLPLLLLPFVENAFKHGPADSHHDSYIHIDLLLQAGRLTFVIENSTENAAPGGAGEGIGLKNVRRQLELTYPGYALTLEHNDRMFRVTLTVNLQYENDSLPAAGR